MGGVLTRAELDAEVAAVGDDTRRRLGLVPYVRRYGDWQALALRHREMVAILEAARVRLGELRPEPDRAAGYQRYLDGLDRQLVLERAVLSAAEAADMDGFRDAMRALARALDEIQAVGVRAGLRSLRTPLRQRMRIWATLPWALMRAQRFARAEARAGRRWQ